jgi:hypothetical protein
MSLTTAIHSLRPNTEWTLDGDDVENIVWHTSNVDPLTIAEVQAEMIRLEEEKLSKKAAAEAKLALLGLDVDDLKALGLG